MDAVANMRNLCHLSEAEYEKISEVLRRSQELNREEEDRLRTLQKEINRLKEIADGPMSSSDEPYFCYLCRQMCGLIMERVEACPTCHRGVCKFCRRDDSFDLGLLSPTQLDSLRRKRNRGLDVLWSCTLCYKIKELKVCSGTWIQEGQTDRQLDKQVEINMNDTNIADMNQKQPNNDKMNNNVTYAGDMKLKEKTSSTITKTETPKSNHKLQQFHDYYSDDDYLSAISEEPRLDEVREEHTRNGSISTLGCLEAHEKFGHLDSPSPHEVSSLTLYIQDSSEPKDVEPVISRTIKIRSVKDRSVDNETQQSGVFITQPQEVNDCNVQTKSFLVKKLTTSSSKDPKPNSIKLLSVTSHQNDSNMNLSEDYTDFRKSIIFDSQKPSGKRLHEMNGNTNHIDHSLMNGSSTQTVEHNGFSEDEEDSEEVKFDFYYGGEGKLLIPVSQNRKNSNLNSNSNVNSIAHDMADYIAWEAADDAARMNPQDEVDDLDRFFSGVVVVDRNQYSFESSDPRIQHYYFNGVRRSYEKKFPFEDGWFNDATIRDSVNGQVENVKESISVDGMKVKEIKEKKMDEKVKDDLKSSSSYPAGELKKEQKEAKTPEKVDAHNDVKSDLKKVTEVKKSDVKVHKMDDETDEVDCAKHSMYNKGVASDVKLVILEKVENVLSPHDHQKNKLDVSGDDKHVLESKETTQLKVKDKMEVVDADHASQSVISKKDELKSKVVEEVQEVTEGEKAGNKNGDEVNEEELRKFLERINNEISQAVERHETAREELLTQQQLRLDVYVAELNNYIQHGSSESAALDEEEWAEEVEKIQNEEVGELLEDQRLELEELERIRRSILEHLGMKERVEKRHNVVMRKVDAGNDKAVEVTLPLKDEKEKSEKPKNDFEDVKEFVRSGRLDDYVDEITRNALKKSLKIQELEADDNEASYPSERQLQLVTSPDADKFTNNLSGLVLEEIKNVDTIEIKDDDEEKEEEETTGNDVVDEPPVYAKIVVKPKQTTELDENSSKIATFFNTGEEFDEVSKTTTTFGDDISTVSATVYKKDDKCSNGVVNSGDVPLDTFDEKILRDEKVSMQDDKDGVRESEESAFTSSESPELSSEGEMNKIARQMEGLYASKMALAGQIHFGMFYDEKTKFFEIYVHRCKDIIGLGRTNPYVKAYLMPDKTRRGKRKTFPRKNTENPVFNEILKYKIAKSELESRILSLTVWHHTTFHKNELLGEVVLPLSGVDLDDKDGRWYPIHQGVGSQRWKSILDLNHDAKVELSVLYTTKGTQNSTQVGDLRVKVVQAMSLTSFREDRLCDAFVECFLHTPLIHDAKAKSSTRKSTRNPEWNQEFCFANVTREQLRTSRLEITIWTQEGFSDKEFLGGIKLYSEEDSANPEVELWETVLNSPNEIVTAVLPLRSTMDETLMDY